MRFWVRGHARAVGDRGGRGVSPGGLQRRARSPRRCAICCPASARSCPPSIDIVPIYDRSLTIVNSVQDVQATLFIAFGLVVLVIFLFLGRATRHADSRRGAAAVAAAHVHRR